MDRSLALKIADACQFMPTDLKDPNIDPRVHQSCYELVLMAANALGGRNYTDVDGRRAVLYGWLRDREEARIDYVSRDRQCRVLTGEKNVHQVVSSAG